MGWKLRERWNREFERRGGLPPRLSNLVTGKLKVLELFSLLESFRNFRCELAGPQNSAKFSATRRRAGGSRPRSLGGVRRLDFGIDNFRICNFLAESMRYSSTSVRWNRFYGLRLGEPVIRYAAGSRQP